MSIVDEVVVAIVFDKLIATLPYSIEIEITIFIRSVLYGKLAFRVKVIKARIQPCSRNKSASQINNYISCVLIIIIDKIIFVIKSYKLITFLL